MQQSLADILDADDERRAALNAPYNPITGEGSPIARTRLALDEHSSVLVPDEMLQEPHVRAVVDAGTTLKAYIEAQGRSWPEARRLFHQARMGYDFEFWCAKAASIEVDAETREEIGTDIAPLTLNRAQRQYYKVLHRLFWSGEPVRVILLKARQWGGSTLTQCFFAWVQTYHKRSWNAFVCTLTLDQARHVRGMYDRLSQHYPREIGTLTLSSYQGSTNVKRVVESDSLLGITTIERPDSPRSFSIHLAHLSEVGLWPSTPRVNASSYAQAIQGAVPQAAKTVVVEESTARGVGTYYHQHWQAAQRGASNYVPVFIAWHDIPKYQRAVEDRPAFARSHLRPDLEQGELLPEHVKTARRLWRLGATLAGINWYMRTLKDFKGQLQPMQSEYPSTPAEAFQSTGMRYFSMDLTAKLRARTRPPTRGLLRSDAQVGPEALQDITHKERRDGPLKMWRRPDAKVWHGGQLLTQADMLYPNRYAAFADFGGKSEGADYSVVTIADRIKMLEGGPVEVVARLRLHVRPDIFAWMSARLATWYDDALLAYEINRHRKDRGDDVRGYEPEWSLAVIEEVMDAYDNLYLRTIEDRVDEPVRMEVGFHMNQSTKPLLFNTLEAGLDDDTYRDPDRRFVDEADVFEKKENGRLGAVDGNHDDVMVSTAGTAWLALKYMDPVRAVEPYTRPRRAKPSAARF